MQYTAARLIMIVAFMAAGLALTGCENDGKDWVAPSDISGTWVSERGEINTDMGPFRFHMTITQNGSDVSAAKWMVYESGTTTTRSRYSGTYASGLVTLNDPYISHQHYYRFTSDTTMYSVGDPEGSRPVTRYTRQ